MASNHCCRLGSECSVNRKVSKDNRCIQPAFYSAKKEIFFKNNLWFRIYLYFCKLVQEVLCSVSYANMLEIQDIA